MNTNGMVIIGAGEAGTRAALELRELGWKGAITLIGDEKRSPYERPPLSKSYLTSQEAREPATIVNVDTLRERGIQFLTGDAAVRIDRDRHEVELASGSRISYERLLLATGARPRQLQTGGSGDGRLLYLRRIEDAAAIREKLVPGNCIAVIGGGFIGLETAAAAIERGCRVTLIEAAPRILIRGVPEAVAAMVEKRHRAAGVEFRTGVGISTVEVDGEGVAVILADSSRIAADAVIAGIGAVPETSLAESCGLDTDNGIKVDERLGTSDSHIFAAGDCCSFPHPLYDGKRIRLEAWRNAKDQGQHAAGSMLGKTNPYDVVPWFWSDQYEMTLQVSGLADATVSMIERDHGESAKLFFHLDADGRLIAASGMDPGGGISKEIRLAEMLIEKRAKPDPAALANPTVRLKALLRECEVG
ncbi:NAD(P)/FAD-dependent oxidoreductase [Paenibacillus solisilvae]|uniref:NAD(P)/FAD-dependent oxidoreductase n=1 Tax=Paenibacillus solisilvae TaxID=2486751 RepID=A0ABW0W2K1_9BACL